jgi:hypothetical protein
LHPTISAYDFELQPEFKIAGLATTVNNEGVTIRWIFLCGFSGDSPFRDGPEFGIPIPV